MSEQNGQGIDLSQTKILKCNNTISVKDSLSVDDAKECESEIFIKIIKVRKIPRILSKTGMDEIMYMEILQCKECETMVSQKQLDEL